MTTEIFSKRQKLLRGEVPDVFTYDEIPKPLRIQVLLILEDAIGPSDSGESFHVCASIQGRLCREHGVMNLTGLERYIGPWEDIATFLRAEKDHEKVLDLIEVSFQTLQGKRWGDYRTRMSARHAIDELNKRFLEHGIGYQYESGTIIRKDSEFLHSEVVRPTLQLLGDKRFVGANEEILTAHEHYRHGRLKEALNECLKAFESTMKCICEIRRWSFQKNDTAKSLIDVCLSNRLVPEFQLSQLQALRSLLETGVPTVRNKLSGHGQGAVPVAVSEHYASYLLHLTATTIKFLIECEKELG
jgi:uncharacterized protein DUF7014/AbiJ-like protein